MQSDLSFDCIKHINQEVLSFEKMAISQKSQYRNNHNACTEAPNVRYIDVISIPLKHGQRILEMFYFLGLQIFHHFQKDQGLYLHKLKLVYRFNES